MGSMSEDHRTNDKEFKISINKLYLKKSKIHNIKFTIAIQIISLVMAAGSVGEVRWDEITANQKLSLSGLR